MIYRLRLWIGSSLIKLGILIAPDRYATALMDVIAQEWPARKAEKNAPRTKTVK